MTLALPVLPQTLPPSDLEIEQALLSILMHDNRAYEVLPEILKAEHFYDPLHQRIFDAVSRLISKGRLANPITLAQFFREEGRADEEQYLAELGALLVPPSNVGDYAQQVHEFFLRRQLVTLGQDISKDARTFDVSGPGPHEQIEGIEEKLFSLTTHGSQERGVMSFSAALGEAIQMAETAYRRDSHVVGITTGFTDLDRLLGGLHPSDLIIIGGRPSMGKTALATNMAFNAALSALKGTTGGGGTVAFFSLEMSAVQLATRLLGQETGISSDRIRRGAVEQKHFPMFVDVARQLSEIPLFIDDTPALSVASLRTRSRRIKRRRGLDLIVIDYLQLMTTGGHSSPENRVQELSQITRGLKALAKEMNVPVIALSQLSRAVEQRDDKRPRLADLRESGTIEQDADVVMFVYREEYYESRKKPADGSDDMPSWQKNMGQVHNIAEVIIAKQRHGPIATVTLHFDGQKTKFSSMSKESRGTL